jgi:dCTP deaminase
MIEPYVGHQVKHTDHRILSYGLSSFGYDARADYEFEIFDPCSAEVIDPKTLSPHILRKVYGEEGKAVIIPGHGFALCSTVEYFRIPRDIAVLCVGKSTYARCGLVVNVTPLEPEWEGHVTIELSNTTPLPLKVYPGEGICQFLFFRGEDCGVSYSDRKGKYQGQTRGVTLPRV